jgi:hypothetical protein
MVGTSNQESEASGSGSMVFGVDRDLLLKQLSLFLDIYKQHFELFIKSAVVYLAVLGATAGYVFRDGAGRGSQVALSVFIVLLSGLAIFACEVSGRWVRDLEAVADKIADSIQVERFPFSGAKMAIRAVEGLCLLVLLGAALNSWLVVR